MESNSDIAKSDGSMSHATTSSSSNGQSGSSCAATDELSRNLSLALMGSSVGGGSINGLSTTPQFQQLSQPQPDTSGSTTAASTSPSTVAIGKEKQSVHAANKGNSVTPSEAASSSSTSSSTTGEDKPSSSSTASISPTDEDTPASRKKAAKKDRSKLRKGKWTVEEEEYTTRIIHHFSTGLLTLPEGATLRSFLADKLNCDPMRITKKFAGASCLGRRVFHLRNRPQPSYEEIQMAKAELDRLEQRFRLRVEHGYGGMPLTSGMVLKFAAPAEPVPQPSAMMAQQMPIPPPGFVPAPNAALATTAATTFLQNFAAAAAAAAAAGNGNSPVNSQGGTPAPTFPFPMPSAVASAPTAQSLAAPQLASSFAGARGAPTPSAAQWLLPSPQAPSPTAASAPGPPPQSVDASFQAVNDAVTNWAWAQVAASLSNALPQLTAANLQQHQQQQQQQQLMASLSSVLPQLAAVNLQQQQPAPVPQPPQQQPQHTVMHQQQQAALQQQHLHALQQQQQQAKLEETPKVQAKQQQKQMFQKNHTVEANSFALQLRQAYEKQLKAREQAEMTKVNVPPDMPKEAPKPISAEVAAKPRKSSEGSVKSKGSKGPKHGHKDKKKDKSAKKAAKLAKSKAQQVAANEAKASQTSKDGQHSEEDEADGTILMGFLSSLRSSYDDALGRKGKGPGASDTPAKIKKRPRLEDESSAKKQKLEHKTKLSHGSSKPNKSQVEGAKKPSADSAAKSESVKKTSEANIPVKSRVSAASSLADSYRQFTTASLQNRRTTPAYITDMSTSTSETSSGNNSTNPVESSLEDSDSNSDKCGDVNSEKGKDNPSSSEDDDKMDVRENRDDRFRSKGPPRKRMKVKKGTDDPTRNTTAVESQQQKATS